MTTGLRRQAMRLALVLLLPASLAAQPMAPRVSVAQIADSVAATGDTARAVAMLDSAIRRDKRDAAAWHQLGLLLWNQARSARNPNVMKDQKKIRLLVAADTSLRLATKLAPDSARYWLSLSRFNIQSGVSTMRFASTGQALMHLVQPIQSSSRITARIRCGRPSTAIGQSLGATGLCV